MLQRLLKITSGMFLIVLLSSYTHFDPDAIMSLIKSRAITHFICIDGGASKTSVKILNRMGEVQYFYIDKHPYKEWIGPPTNVTEISERGLQVVLQNMLNAIVVERQPIMARANEFAVVSGFSGLITEQEKEHTISLFESLGFAKQHIFVASDAELALMICRPPSVALLVGAGSLCVSKIDHSVTRVGGLGKVLGDEGSGFTMGKEALRAAFAQEIGYGPTTSLTKSIKESWKTDTLSFLLRSINTGLIHKDEIAALTKLVFQEAEKEDSVALAIIQNSAKELAQMIQSALAHHASLIDCDLILLGRIWQNPQAKLLLEKIVDDPSLRANYPRLNFSITNKASENLSVLAVFESLRG